MPSRGLQDSGDLDTSESVFPSIYCTTRFLFEEHGNLRPIDWNGVVQLLIQNRDPLHPAEGQVWLTSV